MKKRIVGKRDGKIVDLSPTDLKIVGTHNLSNAVCAAALGFYFGADKTVIEPALTHFRGVSHALEYVDTIRGIQFYNDSAATNPEATCAALASFTDPIILIVGGYDKHIDWKGVLTAIAPRVNGVAIIGQLRPCKLHKKSSTLTIAYANNAFNWCVHRAISAMSLYYLHQHQATINIGTLNNVVMSSKICYRAQNNGAT